MALTPIAGIGQTPLYGAPNGEKKVTYQECLDYVISRIGEEPSLVRNQFNLISAGDLDVMRSKMWPAIFEPSNWTRTATHRPSVDENGERIYGTNREVRTFENDVWFDDNRVLEAKVTTEFGEITDLKITAKW